MVHRHAAGSAPSCSLAVALGAAATASLGGLTARASDEWTRTYPLAADGEVQITNANGSIEVEGVDGAMVDVRAERIARGATDAAARELLPRIDHQGRHQAEPRRDRDRAAERHRDWRQHRGEVSRARPEHGAGPSADDERGDHGVGARRPARGGDDQRRHHRTESEWRRRGARRQWRRHDRHPVARRRIDRPQNRQRRARTDAAGKRQGQPVGDCRQRRDRHVRARPGPDGRANAGVACGDA